MFVKRITLCGNGSLTCFYTPHHVSYTQSQTQLPFTNKAIGFPEFQQLKPTLPSGQLPILEIQLEETDGGTTTATHLVDQSNSIMRYVGTIGGLYPGAKDPLLALKVDQAIDTVEEVYKYLSFTLMGPKGVFFQDKSLTDEEKIEIRTKMMDPTLVEKNAAYVSVPRIFLLGILG
jgi:hypothetical protein